MIDKYRVNKIMNKPEQQIKNLNEKMHRAFHRQFWIKSDERIIHKIVTNVEKSKPISQSQMKKQINQSKISKYSIESQRQGISILRQLSDIPEFPVQKAPSNIMRKYASQTEEKYVENIKKEATMMSQQNKESTMMSQQNKESTFSVESAHSKAVFQPNQIDNSKLMRKHIQGESTHIQRNLAIGQITKQKNNYFNNQGEMKLSFSEQTNLKSIKSTNEERKQQIQLQIQLRNERKQEMRREDVRRQKQREQREQRKLEVKQEEKFQQKSGKQESSSQEEIVEDYSTVKRGIQINKTPSMDQSYFSECSFDESLIEEKKSSSQIITNTKYIEAEKNISQSQTNRDNHLRERGKSTERLVKEKERLVKHKEKEIEGDKVIALHQQNHQQNIDFQSNKSSSIVTSLIDSQIKQEVTSEVKSQVFSSKTPRSELKPKINFNFNIKEQHKELCLSHLNSENNQQNEFNFESMTSYAFFKDKKIQIINANTNEEQNNFHRSISKVVDNFKQFVIQETQKCKQCEKTLKSKQLEIKQRTQKYQQTNSLLKLQFIQLQKDQQSKINQLTFKYQMIIKELEKDKEQDRLKIQKQAQEIQTIKELLTLKEKQIKKSVLKQQSIGRHEQNIKIHEQNIKEFQQKQEEQIQVEQQQNQLVASSQIFEKKNEIIHQDTFNRSNSSQKLQLPYNLIMHLKSDEQLQRLENLETIKNQKAPGKQENDASSDSEHYSSKNNSSDEENQQESQEISLLKNENHQKSQKSFLENVEIDQDLEKIKSERSKIVQIDINEEKKIVYTDKGIEDSDEERKQEKSEKQQETSKGEIKQHAQRIFNLTKEGKKANHLKKEMKVGNGIETGVNSEVKIVDIDEQVKEWVRRGRRMIGNKEDTGGYDKQYFKMIYLHHKQRLAERYGLDMSNPFELGSEIQMQENDPHMRQQVDSEEEQSPWQMEAQYSDGYSEDDNQDSDQDQEDN